MQILFKRRKAWQCKTRIVKFTAIYCSINVSKPISKQICFLCIILYKFLVLLPDHQAMMPTPLNFNIDCYNCAAYSSSTYTSKYTKIAKHFAIFFSFITPISSRTYIYYFCSISRRSSHRRKKFLVAWYRNVTRIDLIFLFISHDNQIQEET